MSDTDAEIAEAAYEAKWRAVCDECQGSNDPGCMFPACTVGEDA